jgi:hypothetical protein
MAQMVLREHLTIKLDIQKNSNSPETALWETDIPVVRSAGSIQELLPKGPKA